MNQEWKNIDFEFLINNEILRVPLHDHLSNNDIPIEGIVTIEYVEKSPAPSPKDSLNHDDWVSSVHLYQNW